MKICKKCGAQMQDGARFCTACGMAAEDTAASAQQTERPGGQEQRPETDAYGGRTAAPYSGNVSGYPAQEWQQNYGGQTHQNPYGNPYQNQGYMNYGNVPRTSGMAVASLVLGIVGILLGYFAAAMVVASAIINASWMIFAVLLYVPSGLGILLGIGGIAKTGDGYTKGRGLAIAGLVLGIVFLVIWVIVALIARESVGYAYNLYSLFD